MKRLIVVFFSLLFLSLAVSAHAQVVESARRRSLKIYAGGLGSVSQPDYACCGVAGTSPNRLYGVGAFVDVDFTRWLQIEAEGRWMDWNKYSDSGSGFDNGENTYLIGPRVPIVEYKHFVPYGKFLVGWGSGGFVGGRATVFDYGGGLDYRLGKRWSIRAIDFEFQDWRLGTPNIRPYGGSVGISYRIF